jgi:lactoylglutathione lyase
LTEAAAPPGGVRHFDHVGLHVMDLEASVAFYAGVIGCETVTFREADEPYVGVLTGYPQTRIRSAFLTLPGTGVRLELLEYCLPGRPASLAREAAPGTAHLTFQVDDLDELYRAWTARGVASVSAPVVPTVGPNRGGRVVYMLDPDGYRIELIQRPDCSR